VSDLVRGRYPVTSPAAKLVGLTSNATQGNIAIRSNADWFGVGGWTDGALAATGVGCAVAVPVEVGDPLSKVSLIVGAAAEATGTHAFASLYSGIATPALLAQSVDLTGATAVGPVNARFDFTLASTVVITQAMALDRLGYVEPSVERVEKPDGMETTAVRAPERAVPAPKRRTGGYGKPKR
jgi:hypothetical protein